MHRSAAHTSVKESHIVPFSVRALVIVISVALMTGLTVGYILDQRVQYAAPRLLSPDVERAQLDVSKLSQP
jgi:hypothetical protein